MRQNEDNAIAISAVIAATPPRGMMIAVGDFLRFVKQGPDRVTPLLFYSDNNLCDLALAVRREPSAAAIL